MPLKENAPLLSDIYSMCDETYDLLDALTEMYDGYTKDPSPEKYKSLYNMYKTFQADITKILSYFVDGMEDIDFQTTDLCEILYDSQSGFFCTLADLFDIRSDLGIDD